MFGGTFLQQQLRLIASGAATAAAAAAAFLLLALLPLLAGCGGGGGGGTDAGTTVDGIVRDSSKSDAPVANARVEIGGKFAMTGTTGDDLGRFRIIGARAGAATATITAPGLPPQEIGFNPPVVSGIANGPYEFFINIGQIRGRVLNPQGAPAVGAFVSVISTGDLVTTDAEGKFQVDNIPFGVTEVQAFQGTTSATVQATVSNGVSDIGDIRLQADPNPNPPPPPFTIGGTVALADNGAIAGTTVILLQGAQEIERTTVNEQGRYGFFVPAGSYRVIGRQTGYQDAVADVTVTNPAVPVAANLTLNR